MNWETQLEWQTVIPSVRSAILQLLKKAELISHGPACSSTHKLACFFLKKIGGLPYPFTIVIYCT